ncbi:hypothetical protein [Amycolatopsis rhizosphaerae]|nr:hypothetical protein [Amycolatopsis rhizosphaerae]
MGEHARPLIAIVGSGFSGIGLAIRLRQAGLTRPAAGSRFPVRPVP